LNFVDHTTKFEFFLYWACQAKFAQAPESFRFCSLI